jgi:DNA-binding response OmpR family regulator
MAKIIVIADLLETAERSGRYLWEEGYEVSTAASGAAALEMLAAERPDLVLLDLDMPELEVLDLCRRLKADPQLRDIAIVLAEGRWPSEDIRQGMGAGADDYVVEPSSREMLLARVQSVLRKKTDQDTIGRMNRHLEARIVAHQEAEARAGAFEQYLRLVVDATGARLAVIDADFKLRYVDPPRRAALGDYHGKTCAEYFPGRYAAWEQSHVAEALRTRQPVVVSEQAPSGQDGPRRRVTSIPFQDEKGQWLVAEIHVPQGEVAGD